MKSFILSISFLLYSLASFSQAGFEWAQACGNPFYGETTTRLASDADGNMFMAGSFLDTASFGTEVISSAGGTDFYIAKYNASGETLWLLGDGGEDYEKIHGISVSDDGIFICGGFYGTTSIGGESYPSQGSQDIFLAGYDLSGNYSWSRHIGSPKTDYVSALCTDPAGNIFISGHYYDSISFGDTSIYSAGASDIFVAKYNPLGELIWIQQAGGSSSDQSYSISCDQEGNIVFTGSFFYDITVGDTTLYTQNPTGVLMAKLNNDGELQYAMQVDGNGLTAQSFAAFDNDGDIFFTGNFTDQVNFGSYSFDAGAFNIDIFVTKYSADGSLLWADHGNGLGSDQLISVSAGPQNDFYITGHFLHDIYFGNLMLEYTLCCGSAEIFLIRYTEDGDAAWGDQITGERAMVEALCKNANDELFVAGMFQLQLAFGDIIIESENDYTNFLSGVATGTMISVEEIKNENFFHVYPVPARDHLTIETSAGTTIIYQITDMTGRILLKGQATEKQTLDISSFPAGQFILQVIDYSTGKFEGTVVIKR